MQPASRPPHSGSDAAAGASAPRSGLAPGATASFVRRRLLVADDDADLRGGVVDLLAELQLEILEADSGPQALAIAQASRLHAALLDLHMPGRDMPGLGGLEVLAALRRGGVALPCILYSADLTPALEERVRLAGALAVLHKPVDPSRLRAEVQRALTAAPFAGGSIERT
jgi:CheY-like chemotaxis protein